MYGRDPFILLCSKFKKKKRKRLNNDKMENFLLANFSTWGEYIDYCIILRSLLLYQIRKSEHKPVLFIHTCWQFGLVTLK